MSLAQLDELIADQHPELVVLREGERPGQRVPTAWRRKLDWWTQVGDGDLCGAEETRVANAVELSARRLSEWRPKLALGGTRIDVSKEP